MSLWAAELDFCFSSVGQLKFLIGCHSLNRDAMIPNYKKSSQQYGILPLEQLATHCE